MLFTPGVAVGAMSGSIGGSVASRNRYGTYFRTRAVPVTSTTSFAMNAKARLGNVSAQWQALTDAQRLQWVSWAQDHPVLNRLGQAVVLTGHAAYVQLNARISQAGDTIISVPPIAAAPASLATITLTADIGAGTITIAFTATPLAAGVRLWVRGAVVSSAGINYTRNLEKVFTITAAAQASPYDYQSDIEARFGTLQVGQKVIVFASPFDGATGLLGSPLRAEAVVVST